MHMGLVLRSDLKTSMAIQFNRDCKIVVAPDIYLKDRNSQKCNNHVVCAAIVI